MRLRVLTLNVWALPGPFARDLDARVQAIGAALPGLAPDVAAFQEVWSEAARSQLVALGGEAGLVHAWQPDEAFGGSGLLVLSSFPLREARLHPYELAGVAERIDEADYLGGKGFVELSLHTPGGEVALVNTHLQAAYAARDHDPYVGLRVGQALQLAEHLRDIERPLVLTGDMNFTEAQEEYAVLTGVAHVTDAAAAADQREPTVLGSNPYRRSPGERRIDYVFVRAGRALGLRALTVERTLDGPLAFDGRAGAASDHAALVAELELGGPGRALPPSSRAAVQAARRPLQAGYEDALARRRDQRALSAFGLVAAVLGFRAASHARISRRRFLRGGAIAGASLAGAFGAGRLALTETLRSSELAAYELSLERADALLQRRARGDEA